MRIGAKRIEEIARKYGADTFGTAVSRFLDYGERLARKGLASLPKGRFIPIAEEQDTGVTYNAVVDITDTEFIVDLRDNPPQDPGPNNCSRDDCFGALQMIFKNIADPYGVANGGTFRPIRMLTTPGTVFEPREPAAMGVYYEVGMRLYDMLWRCLAPASRRAPAQRAFREYLRHHHRGRSTRTRDSASPSSNPRSAGGAGRTRRTVTGAMFSAIHGETYNCPAEVAEARYGLYVDRLALSEAPGGAGRFRGGKGVGPRVSRAQRWLLSHRVVLAQ